MGYETKLLIGYHTTQPSFKNKNVFWFQEIARIDLHKVGCLYEDEVSPLVFFYGDDGNTEITKDCYEDKLRAYPVHKVIAGIKLVIKEYGSRSKLKLVLKMLKEMSTWGSHDNKVSCILFGY
jgi:hypothetical protein